MRRISKRELRFALVATGILVILALMGGDFVMAIVFATVAALGTIWQVRHTPKPTSEASIAKDDNRAEHDDGIQG